MTRDRDALLIPDGEISSGWVGRKPLLINSHISHEMFVMKESRSKENKSYPICLKAYGYYPPVTNRVRLQKILL